MPVAAIASTATITERIRRSGMLAQASFAWTRALTKPRIQVASSTRK